MKIIKEGSKFGKLTVIRRQGSSSNHKKLWLCQCECGNFCIVRSDQLRSGRTKSCGCLKSAPPVHIKHGMYKSRLYDIWKGMLSRCYCKTAGNYCWYGALGVVVCKEWHEFIPFKNWALQNGYSNCLTIDRVNPFGNYEPLNCRWITNAEQQKNKRRTALRRQSEKRQQVYISPTVYQIGGKSQMFKVTMTNLGRKHATEIQSFENEPDGGDLYGMAAKHLLSSNIWFSVDSGDPDKSVYPVAGTVCAGVHHVGDFKVEEVSG